MQNSDQVTGLPQAAKLSRSQKRRQQRRRQKARGRASQEALDSREDSRDSREESREQARQRLRAIIQKKQEYRQTGGKRSVMVPAPVPGELTPQQLQQYQKKMQKLASKKGRHALMESLGVEDKQQRAQLARAMVSGDTQQMTEIMQQVHTPHALQDTAADSL